MNFTSKLLAAGVVLSGAMFSFSAEAVNRIYINDFTIDSYEVKEVQVMLENTDPAAQTRCHVILPEGLELVGEPTVNTERFPGYMTNAKVSTTSDGKVDILINCLTPVPNTFLAGNSAMATFSVTAKEGMLNEESTETINIEGIEITSPDSEGIEESKTSECTVTFMKEAPVEKILNISCTTKNVIVNPGDRKTVSLNLDNTVEVGGLQMDIMVPENVTIENVKGTYRVPASMAPQIKYNEEGKYYTVLFIGFGGAKFSGESGDFMTFDIVAGDEFYKSGEVTFNRVKSTDTALKTFTGTATPFEVESGYVAFEQAAAAIEELNEYLTKANNTIENECPLVAEDYSVFPLYQEVAALQAAIEKAYNDYTLTPDYASVVTAPIAALKEKIDAHVAAAKEAQAKEEKRRADNKAAYEADLNAIAALQTALDEAKAQVREQYPNFVDEEAENAIQADIDAAKAAVEAAYKAVETEGNYDYKLDADAITSDIANLLPAAAAAAAEADRVAANQKAYNDDLAAIDALQAALDAAKEQVREQYPGFADEDAEDAIQKQIDALKEGAAAALKAVETEGNYDYSFNADEITAEIAQLLPEAAEAYRVDFNEKAYNADIAAIDELVKKYNEAKDEIDALNPSFLEGNKDAEDILSQIDAAREACDKEYDSVKEEGFYESPAEFDAKAIEDSINALLEGVMTGIGVISADMDLTGVEIYTLDGMRHSKLVIGQINILKTEKQVRKVVVK